MYYMLHGYIFLHLRNDFVLKHNEITLRHEDSDIFSFCHNNLKILSCVSSSSHLLLAFAISLITLALS